MAPWIGPPKPDPWGPKPVPEPEWGNEPVIVTDKLLSQSIDGLYELALYLLGGIREVTIALKRKIRDKIAEWLEEGKRGLKLFGLILLSAALVVGITYLSASAGLAGGAVVTSAVFRQMDRVAKVRLLISVVRGVNSVVKVFSPQWRTLTAALTDTWAVVADTVGIPVGIIASFFAAYKGFIYASYAMIGIKPGQAQQDSWLGITRVVQEMEDNFDKYILHPGKILNYIEENLTEPLAEDVSAAGLAQLEALDRNIAAVSDMGTDFENFTDAFGSLVDSLPDAMKDQVKEYTDPLLDGVNLAIDTLRKILSPLADEVVPTLETLINNTRTKLEEQAAVEAGKLAETRRLLGLSELMEADRWKALNTIITSQSTVADASKVVAGDLNDIILSLPHVEPYAEQEPYSEELAPSPFPDVIPPEQIAHPWMVEVDESAPYDFAWEVS